MTSFAPYNGKQYYFPSDPFKPQTCTQGLSFAGERNKGFIFQGFNAFCSPVNNNVPKVPNNYYVMPMTDAYKLYIEPRLDKNWNLVQRSREFLITDEVLNNKSFNSHSSNAEIYASPLSSPNNCVSDFCKYKV